MAFDPEGVWDHFIDYMLSTHSLAMVTPRMQAILIVKKRGRRELLNIAELRLHLHWHFQIRVDVVEIASLPLPAQISLVRQYTVMITPCGGISFSSAFMSRGSATIFIGYYDILLKQPGHMEQAIYTSHLNVRDFYYNPYANETTVRLVNVAEPSSVSEWHKYRDFGDVRIDLPRMSLIVHEALSSVEATFGWHHSFVRSNT